MLLDTHSWFWFLSGSTKLSTYARSIIEKHDAVWVSSVSMFELSQKIGTGRGADVAEIEPWMDKLEASFDDFMKVELSPRAARLSGRLDWDHRDPFDRLLCAVAIDLGVPFLSKDSQFDLVKNPGWKGRVWSPPEPADPGSDFGW